ncbi:MAG: DUF3047 domain-containing protein [Methylococcales bacterium]|nr:DUF3047 domain-containing protein [Methylococcales bacterium]
MKKRVCSLIIILWALALTASAENIKISVGKFSSDNMEHWKEKNFAGKTTYQIVTLDKSSVLKAESHSAASGLFKEQRIDLSKTPYLNWRWRVENDLGNIDEQSKSGDDYSARVYVVVDGGWAFWKTKAINYVWSSHQEKGKVWPNAFAGTNAMMIALRTSSDKKGAWFTEKRNIQDDLKQQFGEDIQYIDVIALMTDTDNAKGDAIAYYGDIYFTKN